MNMNAKRFTWLKKDGYAPQIVITDSLTEKDLTPTDCYELLNKLAEENKQLKQEMGDLGTAHAEEINKIENEFDEEILKLERENERLKKDVEYYKTERLALFKYIDKIEDLELELKVEK